MSSDSYRQRDIKHIWHPYSDIAAIESEPFPVIQRGEGIYIYDADGRKLIDGISSWWCCNLGHSHPRLVEALCSQAQRLQHSMLGGMSHPSAIDLAERLSAVCPTGLGHVLFAGDGSSAVEAALKISVQYWANLGEGQRTEFASLEDAYHGDTLGAMGVGFIPGFHEQFAGIVRQAHRASSPYCRRCPAGKTPKSCNIECFESMRRLVEEHGKRLAAVIVEPLCQAAAGMRVYPAEYLRRLRILCDSHSLLLIADEVAMGFGRSGTMFACNHAGISPDILCLGKAMTGGYLPMSATVVTKHIYDAFRSSPTHDRSFHHGHTFSGNPLAAAVALAVLDVFEDEKILSNAEPLVAALAKGIGEMADLGPVQDVRCLGMIGAVEFSCGDGGEDFARRVCSEARGRGLHIRPLDNVVYLWPPLTITPAELRESIAIVNDSIAAVSRGIQP